HACARPRAWSVAARGRPPPRRRRVHGVGRLAGGSHPTPGRPAAHARALDADPGAYPSHRELIAAGAPRASLARDSSGLDEWTNRIGTLDRVAPRRKTYRDRVRDGSFLARRHQELLVSDPPHPAARWRRYQERYQQ